MSIRIEAIWTLRAWCFRAACAVFAVAATCGGAAAQTEKLAPEACRILSSQVMAAERDGARAVFEQGPEWARENATPAQIASVRQYISLREQLQFRCPIGFDNLVVAAINGDIVLDPPPLPERPASDVIAMKRALLTQSPRRPGPRGVPLPVRKPAQLRP